MDQMEALIPEMDYIEDGDLRKKTASVWQEALRLGGWGDPGDVPFNIKIGNPPSLIHHTRAVTRNCFLLAGEYQEHDRLEVDRDLLAVTAILHDVSKCMEYGRESGRLIRSPLGEKFPHGMMGGFLAWKFQLPLDAVHLIISHTPASSVTPRRVEGVILRYADLMDADFRYHCAGMELIMSRNG